MAGERSFFIAALSTVIMLAAGLSYFALHHGGSDSPGKQYNTEVAKNFRVAIQVFKSKAKVAGDYKPVPLPSMGPGHALMVTGDGIPIGYHMDGRDYFFKDEAEGSRACAYFFQAALWAYRISVVLADSTLPEHFNGYVVEGSRNNGFGGCRYSQHFSDFSGTPQYDIYYSTTDGSIFTHEQEQERK
ncbi:MAG: hypothetical protein V4490_03270 [Pseudomonadota bacterium]